MQKSKMPARAEPGRTLKALPVLTVISTVVSAAMFVWNAWKRFRRSKAVDAGGKIIEANKGEEADYEGLEKIQDGIYHRDPSKPRS